MKQAYLQLLAKILFVCLLSASCGDQQESKLDFDLTTFASGPLNKRNSCDMSKLNCRYKALSKDKQEALEESLGWMQESLDSDKADYVKVVDITKTDIESASHSCVGNRCTATFQKNIPLDVVASRDFPIKSKANIKLSYLRGTNKDSSVSMHRVALSGETKTFNITKFISVEVDGGIYFDTYGTRFASGIFDYNYFFRANITSQLPYFTFAVEIDKRGLSISSVNTDEFRKKFLRNRLPIVANTEKVTLSDIKRDFVKNVQNQARDPKTDEYWEQFGERLIVLDGY